MSHRVLAAGALVAALGLGCQGTSTAPSSPSPQPTPSGSPTPTPRPTVTPTHTLTITASLSCTALPAGAKKRSYPAQLQEKPNGDLLVLVVNSADIMVGWANDAGFTGKRDGHTVRFNITDDMFAAYAMIERIPGIGDMGYFGTARGTIDDARKILATFDGQYRDSGTRGVLCEAPDHHIEVIPLGS